MTLGTVGSTYYPETEGIYHRVCQSPNGWPIYQKENSSEILRYRTDNSSYSFWYFADKASPTSQPKVLKPVSLSGECPGPESGGTWFVFEVFFQSLKLICNSVKIYFAY